MDKRIVFVSLVNTSEKTNITDIKKFELLSFEVFRSLTLCSNIAVFETIPLWLLGSSFHVYKIKNKTPVFSFL